MPAPRCLTSWPWPWPCSRHPLPPPTCSFADYYNPKNMNFGALRVLNDDLIKAKVRCLRRRVVLQCAWHGGGANLTLPAGSNLTLPLHPFPPFRPALVHIHTATPRYSRTLSRGN